MDKVQVEGTHLSRMSRRSGAEELLSSLLPMRVEGGERGRQREEYLEDMTSPGMTKVVKEILQEEEETGKKQEASRIVSSYASSSPRSRVNAAAGTTRATSSSSSAASEKGRRSHQKKVVQVKMNLPSFQGGAEQSSSLESEQTIRTGEERGRRGRRGRVTCL
eukprot:751363-Hanusia_phi.AAC.3